VKTIPLVEVAQTLGMSWERAWRLLLSGRLSGVKEGGRWLVTVDSVEAMKRSLDQTLVR
jgi:hypothetical protein